ncbi:MAG: hypothetical protein ACYTFQ_24935 [Planctomycetota bacterium]|jgi:hypothetical protein
MMGELARRVLGMKQPKRRKDYPEDAMAVKRASEILVLQGTTYFKGILKQLEAVAHAPVNVGEHQTMIEQVGKQNAYRELLLVFKKDLDTAERVLAQDQARQRQG